MVRKVIHIPFVLFLFSCATAGSGSEPEPEPDARPAIDCTVAVCTEGIYVDANGGSDDNPGTQESPLATINGGIYAAEGYSPPRPVYISGGVFNEEVEIKNGVSRQRFIYVSEAI